MHVECEVNVIDNKFCIACKTVFEEIKFDRWPIKVSLVRPIQKLSSIKHVILIRVV